MSSADDADRSMIGMMQISRWMRIGRWMSSADDADRSMSGMMQISRWMRISLTMQIGR
jgi:hypothetical protein